MTGCLLRLGGEEVTVRARETILAAGAIWSPVLLMRSGIGPAAALRAGAGGACRSAWRG
nr:GMC family oxidoreductase N-terminal domain-containing protein [Pseudoroseomonas wenyumeiae]